ncbi:hypothetical protein DV738_g1755, partial [Chaetothyriales sp. CBS 135597]
MSGKQWTRLAAACWAGLLLGSSQVTANPAPNSYDYVIVGGGLTGLVVANRLSEDPNEPGLNNQTSGLLIGSVVGGGSTVNGMFLDRSSAADYDSWEALGNPGWGWKDLFPYFLKSTKLTPPDPEIQEQYNYSWDTAAYGPNGLLQASFPEFLYPDVPAFFDAFEELNIPFIEEHALGDSVGVFWAPSSQDPVKQTRSSSLTAYYDPASSRSNLLLLTQHQVTEILFNKGKNLEASGVKATDLTTGESVQFTAKKEVILAAGAIHTPQILQLSGIGPKAVLEAAGVSVKRDFPAVGSNFQDHPVAYPNWNVSSTFPYPGILLVNETFNQEAIALYESSLTGPYTYARGSSVAFLSLDEIADDSESLLTSLASQEATQYLPPIYQQNPAILAGFLAQKEILIDQIGNGTVGVLELPFSGIGSVPHAIQKPLSRGTVYLNASSPHSEPVLTNYAFYNPFDVQQLFASVGFTRKLFNTNALAYLNPVETLPGTDAATAEDVFDALLAAQSVSTSFAHPSGSAPLLPEHLGGVVSPELLVYGTQKLSIVDASILPIIPAGHLQASLYAVAEKAADLIKARAKPQTGEMDEPPIEVDDPPLRAADLLAKRLAKHLTLSPKEGATSWEEETSEPKFKSSDAEQSYQWACEELRQTFKPRVAERLRMEITETEYWEREARHYRDAANEQIWQNALDKYSQGHTPGTADAWRSIAKFYQGVLVEHGLALQKAKDVRLSIDAEKYWQLEAQFYQRQWTPQEREWRSASEIEPECAQVCQPRLSPKDLGSWEPHHKMDDVSGIVRKRWI